MPASLQYLKAIRTKAADGSVEFVASDETLDRSGESIPASSWDLENFLKSPRLLVDHDYSVKSVVGIAEDTRVEGKQLKFKPKFHEITELAKTVAEMVAQKILDTVSVGFLRKQQEDGSVKNELMEISFVAVPANPNARRLAVKTLDDAETKAVEAFLGEIGTKVWDETDEQIRHRVREPELFDDSTFRTVTIKEDKPRVMAVMGKLKGEDTMTVQSVLFPKEDGWTMEDAKKWMDDHPDMAKAAEPQEGDSCTMEDGSEGTMQMDESGALVCMMKKKAPPEDSDMMATCMAAMDKAESAVMACCENEEMPTEEMVAACKAAFVTMKEEVMACMEKMGEMGKAIKSGRVLSEKNRVTIKSQIDSLESVIAALKELHDAAQPQGNEDQPDPLKRSNPPAAPCLPVEMSRLYETLKTHNEEKKLLRLIATATSEALRKAKLQRTNH